MTHPRTTKTMTATVEAAVELEAVRLPYHLALKLVQMRDQGYSVVLSNDACSALEPDNELRTLPNAGRVGTLDVWVGWIGGAECPPRAPETAPHALPRMWPFGIGQRDPKTRAWTWLREATKACRVVTYPSAEEADKRAACMRLKPGTYDIAQIPPEANHCPDGEDGRLQPQETETNTMKKTKKRTPTGVRCSLPKGWTVIDGQSPALVYGIRNEHGNEVTVVREWNGSLRVGICGGHRCCLQVAPLDALTHVLGVVESER